MRIFKTYGIFVIAFMITLLSGVLLLTTDFGGGISAPDNSQEEVVTPPEENSDGYATGTYHSYTALKSPSGTISKYNWGSGYGICDNGNNASLSDAQSYTYHTSSTGVAKDTFYTAFVCPYSYVKVPLGYNLVGIYRSSSDISSSTSISSSYRAGTTSLGSYYHKTNSQGDGLWYIVGVIERKSCTISYSPGAVDATGSTPNTTAYYGINNTLATNGFSRKGYHFDHWYHTTYVGSTKKEWTFTSGQTVSWSDLSSAVDGVLMSSLPLMAEWTINNYSISYNLNNGSWPHSSTSYHPTSATYNSTINIENPTRTGYTFTGWTISGYFDGSTAQYGNSSSSCTTTWSSSSTKPTATYYKNLSSTTNGVTLTANWERTNYNITLNANGGTHMSTPTITNISGYNFTQDSSGFYVSGNKGVQSSYSLCKVSFTAPVNGSTLGIAVINYAEANYDFGIFSNLDTTLTSSSDVDTSNVYKSFKGLSKPELQTVQYTNISAGSHYIYVKFRKDGSGDSYNDSLKFKVLTSSAVAHHEVSMPSVSIPYRTGYTFQGYYDSLTNGMQYYDKSGICVHEYSIHYTSTTLYARWTPNTYYIDFERNDSGGYMSSQTATYGTPLKLNSNGFIKTAYNFLGWKASGINTSYAKYGSSSSPSTSLTTSTTIPNGNYVLNLTPTANGRVTLTAQWSPITYSITYVLNGGTLSGSYLTSYNIDGAITLPTPTRSGYNFTGWTPNGAGNWGTTTLTTNPSRRFGNVTLTANWQEKTWSEGYYASSYGGGDGTQSNPYIISTAAHLARLAYATNNNLQTTSGRYDKNAYYKQTADIDINAHEWEPIGGNNAFAGSYDGNQYIISNLRLTIGYGGLFRNLSGSTIKGINIKSATIHTPNSHAFQEGILAGNAAGALIEKCVIEDISAEANAPVGGIVGWASSTTIRNCRVDGGTMRGVYAGGIVGGATGSVSVENCSVYNVALNSSTVGVVIGYQSGSNNNIIASYGNGTLNGTETKSMYGDSSVWGDWSLIPNVNGGLPIQKGLYHIGGFTDPQEVYNYLTGQGYTVVS